MISDHPFDWKLRLFGEYVGERAAVKILHHQIRDSIAIHVRETEVSYIHYVWVMHSPRRFRLASEAFDELVVHHELRGDDFDGDRAVGSKVSCQINRCPCRLVRVPARCGISRPAPRLSVVSKPLCPCEYADESSVQSVEIDYPLVTFLTTREMI